MVEVYGVEPGEKEEGAGKDIIRDLGQEGGEDESSPVIHLAWLLTDNVKLGEFSKSRLELIHQWHGEDEAHEGGKDL